MDTVFGLFAVFFLVMANAFFVAAEFSLVSARRTRIEQLAQDGNKAAIAAQKAMAHLDSYIAATQLGITLASLALGWVGEPAVGHLLESFLPDTPWAHTVGQSISVAVAFAFVTIVHIVLGELVPKSIALQRPEGTALFVARPIRLFRAIFRPVIALMNNLGNWIVSLLGFHGGSEHSNVHSPEELEMLVHSSREAGLLEENEERLLRRVFDFSDVQIRGVMRPRTEVDALNIDSPLPVLLNQIVSQQYSRYPVYKGSVDTVTGILLTKDMLDAVVKEPQLLTGGSSTFTLASILRIPLFVPQTTGVDSVLEQMQKSKQQMVIVIDEYGGMAGVATMEDILEELVGEVQDEFDVESNQVETQGNAILVDGLMTMNDVIERFGDPEGKVISTTIGGYIAERLDRIPILGDTVIFGDYDVRVEEMDGMRASKVRFIKRSQGRIDEPQVDKPASLST
ncbi:MAG: hemolysin family protein [Chloroflexota bacterium]